jgi:hypothetical protein
MDDWISSLGILTTYPPSSTYSAFHSRSPTRAVTVTLNEATEVSGCLSLEGHYCFITTYYYSLLGCLVSIW